MPENTPSTPAAELALFGSKQITVTFFGGQTETVAVKAVPLRDLPKLFDLFDNETGRISLYTGKAPEWVEALSGQSLSDLLEVGDVGNFPRLRSLLPARQRLAAMFPPEATPGTASSPTPPKSPLEATA